MGWGIPSLICDFFAIYQPKKIRRRIRRVRRAKEIPGRRSPGEK
jgi:hypothetical protein